MDDVKVWRVGTIVRVNWEMHERGSGTSCRYWLYDLLHSVVTDGPGPENHCLRFGRKGKILANPSHIDEKGDLASVYSRQEQKRLARKAVGGFGVSSQ